MRYRFLTSPADSRCSGTTPRRGSVKVSLHVKGASSRAAPRLRLLQEKLRKQHSDLSYFGMLPDLLKREPARRVDLFRVGDARFEPERA